MELSCDVLVVGGGRAALPRRWRRPTWAAGRVDGGWELAWVANSSQAVPPDEHPWVESTGTTARYRRLRDAVRTRYKLTRRLTERAMRDLLFNPGAAWVSNLSAEPVVFREVLDDLVRPAQAHGVLRCLMRHRPLEAAMDGDQVTAVRFEDLESGEQLTITAGYVLDATEEGDVAADRMRVGGGAVRREYRRAPSPGRPADPLDQQAITWCAALEWRPGRGPHHRPPELRVLAKYRADFWPGPNWAG